LQTELNEELTRTVIERELNDFAIIGGIISFPKTAMKFPNKKELQKATCEPL